MEGCRDRCTIERRPTRTRALGLLQSRATVLRVPFHLSWTSWISPYPCSSFHLALPLSCFSFQLCAKKLKKPAVHNPSLTSFWHCDPQRQGHLFSCCKWEIDLVLQCTQREEGTLICLIWCSYQQPLWPRKNSNIGKEGFPGFQI